MNNQSRHDKPLGLKLVIYTLASLLAGSAIALAFEIYNVKSQTAKPIATSPNTVTIASADLRGAVAQQPIGETTPQPVMPSMMAQADRRFIVMMIPHHQEAVAMAELALSRAQHPEIKKLATAIKESQTREINQMQTWYKRWYGFDVPVWTPGMGMGESRWWIRQQQNSTQRWGVQSMSQRRHNRGYKTGCCMMGGRAGINIYALQNASDFDREFIQQMVPHHQMAVMMSSMVLNSAEHPELMSLAKSIVKNQSAEIQQMQQWYQTWYQ